MAKLDSQLRVTPSILDRLIDLEPRESREAPKSRSSTVRELKAGVRRDLEWLLNSRCFIDASDPGLQETSNSVAVYGLPDIVGINAENYNEQRRLTHSLEQAIKKFEPRFLDVKISMEPPTPTERAIKFRIEANLDMDPVPEPIVFDTVLQLGSGDFVITEKV